MIFRILKKDLLKKRGINFILFLFITLATVFLASSINNILVVGNATKHYMEYARVPDVNIILNNETEKETISNWMDTQKKDHIIEDYDYNNFLTFSEKKVKIQKNNKTIDLNGVSLYLGKRDIDYNKVYDEKGNAFQLKEKEIALPINQMKRNHLKIGDTLLLQIGEEEVAFTIRYAMKDAAFGNDMVGMTRFIISEKDYEKWEQEYDSFGLFYITTKKIPTFLQNLNNKAFSTVLNTVTKDNYQMIYSFDMLMAALLILIGICLILIALLVLRFTLIFTMEEQYGEIGILKAIGFKNFSIQKIYLLKYLCIVVVGSILGFFLSLPVSHFMIESVSQNMIMESTKQNVLVNILCCLFVILSVISFCYFCTRRFRKVSVITALRGGSTGERFEKKKGLSLYKRGYMKVPFFLALNDILSHIRRYAVLLITFAISVILITIPLNTLNTMQSKEMSAKFFLDPESSIFVRSIEQKGENNYTRIGQLEKGMQRLQEELEEKGYKEVSLTGTPIYFLNYKAKNTQVQKLMTLKLVGENVEFAQYEEGSAPLLENEVAFSKTIMEENDWKIGDIVTVYLEGKKKDLLITGSYSDYMQLGKSARINPVIDTKEEMMFDYWNIAVNMQTDLKEKELLKELKKQFPDYEWLTAQELVDQNIGGIQESLKSLLIPMTSLLCLVIMFITLLMEKLFIAREKGEIALLKSMGFSTSSLRAWQVVRMVMVAICSIILAIPLSLLSNHFVLKPIFGIMGADVAIQVDIFSVYFLYPGILVLGIFLATILGTKDIKNIHIREFNNIE